MNYSNISRKKKTIILFICAKVWKYVNRRSKKRRKYWVKSWIERRKVMGIMNLIKSELRPKDPAALKNYLRMTDESFQKLLSKIENSIRKNDTCMREAISAEDKLITTLRFLASGESYRNLMYSTRIHESTISLFIPEVCKQIYLHLKDEYLKVPNTYEEWTGVAEEFFNYWNIPNTLGAMDGKHIAFRASQDSGSIYYNYKGFNSIVLLAVTDAKYQFLYVDVGVNGRVSDGGVFIQSDLFHALESNILHFLPNKPLPNRITPVPHVLIADAAFPLKKYIMKPFPFRGLTYEQRIFNYRISRARRVVENCFGILANRFRIFLTTINLSAEKVKIITLACCTLHNFLLRESPAYKQSCWDENISETIGKSLSRQGGNRPKDTATDIRKEFMEYFNGPGSVPWQDKMVS